MVPGMLAAARAGTYANAAFNVFDELTMSTVLNAAAAAGSPVIVQTSSIVARRLGPRVIAAMFREMTRGSSIPTALQLDHCSEIGLVSACIEARWDAVLFDGSALDPRENIRLTSEVAAEAHRCGVAVEGELESIRGNEAGVSSSNGPSRSLEESLDFIEATGVDAFAPSIGNIHGRADGPVRLDVGRVRALAAASPVPLVLHGGTGIDEDAINSLITAGIAKVNVSTEIRETYMNAVREHVALDPKGLEPTALFDVVGASLATTVSTHLRRFRSEGRVTSLQLDPSR